MLAKRSVWAADRERALARLGRALAELRIEGIRTTAPLYRALLADADFRAGRLDVGMLDRKLASGAPHHGGRSWCGRCGGCGGCGGTGGHRPASALGRGRAPGGGAGRAMELI